MNRHAVYVVDRLPDSRTVYDADIPAHDGHEMAAGPGPLLAVVDGQPVPLIDPMPFWGVSMRVNRTMARGELVAALRALAGALEAGRLPQPADVPDGSAIMLGADEDDDLSPIEKLARRTLHGDGEPL
jgi:hypothetical protein